MVAATPTLANAIVYAYGKQKQWSNVFSPQCANLYRHQKSKSNNSPIPK
jgi:hypothetical protein